MKNCDFRSHVGLNCSLDELIRKEVPVRSEAKRVLKKSGSHVNNSTRRRQKGQNKSHKYNSSKFQSSVRMDDSESSQNGRKNREIPKKPQNGKRNRGSKMRIELNLGNSISEDPESSNVNERENLIKMISIIHNDTDFTMQILLDSSPIIVVNKITGVIQLNSFSCRSHTMLEIWNLLLKPLGLSLVDSSNSVECTNWLITDGSCYMENFKDGMIVRGSGSRDTARNARFSILEQHIKQLII